MPELILVEELDLQLDDDFEPSQMDKKSRLSINLIRFTEEQIQPWGKKKTKSKSSTILWTTDQTKINIANPTKGKEYLFWS